MGLCECVKLEDNLNSDEEQCRTDMLLEFLKGKEEMQELNKRVGGEEMAKKPKKKRKSPYK